MDGEALRARRHAQKPADALDGAPIVHPAAGVERIYPVETEMKQAVFSYQRTISVNRANATYLASEK